MFIDLTPVLSMKYISKTANLIEDQLNHDGGCDLFEFSLNYPGPLDLCSNVLMTELSRHMFDSTSLSRTLFHASYFGLKSFPESTEHDLIKI